MNGSSFEDDEFVRAVCLALDHTPDPRVQQLKQQATAYCNAIQKSADGWQVCLRKLAQHARVQGDAGEKVRFFCLQILEAVAASGYKALSTEHMHNLRSSLMAFVRDIVSTVPLSHAVKSKLALIFIRFIQHEYPQHWPSFFHDFLGMLPRGPQVVDLFLRVLQLIDEEIVEFDRRRSKKEITQNTLIKDTMREKVMDQIVATLHSVISSCQKSEPQLAAKCLNTLQEYIGWINIDLVANEKFVPLFYDLLQSSEFQVGASACLSGIMAKRMPCMAKFSLIHRLKILDVVCGLELKQADEDFLKSVATLVDTVGFQLIECIVAFRDENADAGLQTDTYRLIGVCLELSLVFLQHSNVEVSWAVTTFLSSYLGFLKRVTVALPGAQDHVRAMYAAVSVAIRYPKWYNFDVIDDDEAHFDQYRNQISTLFKNLVTVAPDFVTTLVRDAMGRVFAALEQTPCEETEATLYLFYILPDGLRKAARKLKQEPYRSMIGAFFGSSVSHVPHKRVVLTYMDLVVRYSKFLEDFPQSLSSVVVSIMDARGMHSNDAALRSRACYMLNKLVKSFSVNLRRNLKPMLDQILDSLQKLIQPVLGRAQGVKHGAKPISYADCLKLCEVIGMLVSTSVVGDADLSRKYFSSLFESFRAQLQSGLDQKEVWLQADPDLAGKRMSQVIRAMEFLCKSYNNDAALVVDLLGNGLQTVLQVSIMLPTHEGVRDETIKYIHNMITSLKDKIAPFVDSAISTLLNSTNPVNLAGLMRLINQIIVTIKGDFRSMDLLFTPVLSHVFTALQHFSHIINDPNVPKSVVAAYATEKQARADINKMYILMLQSLISSDLGGVLTSAANGSRLKQVMDLLFTISGLDDGSDNKKNAVCTVVQVAAYLQKAKIPVDMPFKRYVIQEFIKAMFSIVTKPNFDHVNDFSCLTVTNDLAEAQYDLSQVYGSDFLQGLGGFLVQRMQCNQAIAQEYINVLQTDKDKTKLAFKTIMTQWKQATNGSRGPSPVNSPFPSPFPSPRSPQRPR